MKHCTTCNSNNVYEIELRSSAIEDVAIFPFNKNTPTIDIMDLPHMLHATYCNDCKRSTHLTDDK